MVFHALRDRWHGAFEPIDNLVRIAREPYRFLDDLRRRGGELAELRMAGMPTVLVYSEPETVRQILTGSYEQFERFAGGVELFVDPLALILTDDEPRP